MRIRWTLAVAVAAGAIAAIATPPALAAPGPAAMPDRPDLQAANLFQTGKYADALTIYQRLYAETHHPTYLRNIGRCYQNLGEPERAISSFRDYLRKGKDISPSEHAEIDG